MLAEDQLEKQKYYLCDQFDSWSWKYLLHQVIAKSKYIEFNQLFINEKLPPELEWMNKYLVIETANNKIYKSGNSKRFEITDSITHFILSKEFREWRDSYFEDISFFSQEGTEILATITHENYVIKLMTESEKVEMKDKGIDFWCEWETLTD